MKLIGPTQVYRKSGGMGHPSFVAAGCSLGPKRTGVEGVRGSLSLTDVFFDRGIMGLRPPKGMKNATDLGFVSGHGFS